MNENIQMKLKKTNSVVIWSRKNNVTTMQYQSKFHGGMNEYKT